MENQHENTENENVEHESSHELGSNLTGTATPSRTIHESEMPLEDYAADNPEEGNADGDQNNQDKNKEQNTDALIGGVDPANK
jgi:hypothetical protein